jgi:hypothetical protein
LFLYNPPAARCCIYFERVWDSFLTTEYTKYTKALTQRDSNHRVHRGRFRYASGGYAILG